MEEENKIMEHMLSKMKEHSHLAIILLEIITLAAVIVNIFRQVPNNEESRFYEKKLDTYVELVSITGTLTGEKCSEDIFYKLKDEFHGLYNGKSQLFEGRNGIIKDEIIKFWHSLNSLSYTEYSDPGNKKRIEFE